MKQLLALSVLVVLLMVSSFGVLHSFTNGHMQHEGCVFNFGASPECITSIIGSLMRAREVLPVSSLLILCTLVLLVLFPFPLRATPSTYARVLIRATAPRAYPRSSYAQALARGIIHPKKYA